MAKTCRQRCCRGCLCCCGLTIAVFLLSALFGLCVSLLAEANIEPEQIHLAFAGQDAAGNANGMAVSWFTRGEPKDATVQYGLSAKQLDQRALGQSKKYLMLGGFHAHAELVNLTPSTRYYYRVGSSKDDKWSQVLSFKSAPTGLSASFSMAVFGDMGWENSTKRPMWITSHGLRKNWSATESRNLLEKWKDEKSMDFIWHVGDIGYMDDSFAHAPLGVTYESSYNGYMNWLQSLSSTMPYMVSPGNHESECHSPACILDPFLGRALMNFTAYNHRWRMPSASSGGVENMWYSFNIGPVHFVSINTETDFPGAEETDTGDSHIFWLKAGHFAGEGQYLKWLEDDLKAADAARKSGHRPWIIAGGHRALGWIDKSGVKELFDKYKVDLYFAGHAHTYFRDPPVRAGKVTSSEKRVFKDVDGYIQVIAGGAGSDETDYIVAPKCNASVLEAGTCVLPSPPNKDFPEHIFATDVAISPLRIIVLNF